MLLEIVANMNVFLQNIRNLTRVWGILCAIVLWGISIETLYDGFIFGIYLLLVACVTTVAELLFVSDAFVKMQLLQKGSATSAQQNCVNFSAWFDNWRKSIFYAVFGIPCFLRPTDIWLAVLSGLCLLVLSIFYIVCTYHDSLVINQTMQSSPSTAYRRFRGSSDAENENAPRNGVSLEETVNVVSN